MATAEMITAAKDSFAMVDADKDGAVVLPGAYGGSFGSSRPVPPARPAHYDT